MCIRDSYGAAQLNATNQAVNESVDQAKVIDSLDDISANTQPGMVAGALAVAELSGKSGKLIENKTDYQEYTLLGGKVKVISGSVIRTGVGKNYIALFSAEQLKDYFGVTVNTTCLLYTSRAKRLFFYYRKAGSKWLQQVLGQELFFLNL